MMIKLSEEVIKKFGATNANDFNEKLLAFVGSAQESITANSGQTEKITALEAKCSSLEAKLVTVEQKASEQKTGQIDEAKVKEIATAAASAKVIEIQGVTNTTATVSAAPAEAAEQANVKNLLALGKYTEAWAADTNLQNEFQDPKAYAAYKRAEKAGAFKLYKPRTN